MNEAATGRRTTADIRAMKGKTQISCLTAYDAVTSTLLDRAGCDILLVGDSVGNVMLGFDDTLSVTMEDMVRHSAAVRRGSEKALIVTDMPFLSFQVSHQQAIENAGRLMVEGGAQAVKIEGGRRNKELVQKLILAGIPVMGHVGILPQAHNVFGNYCKRGKTEEDILSLIGSAKALEEAGAFSVVLECLTDEAAARVTAEISIPTIGIGSGKNCDGQVLVINDLLGYFTSPPPSFATPKVDLAAIVLETAKQFVDELKSER